MIRAEVDGAVEIADGAVVPPHLEQHRCAMVVTEHPLAIELRHSAEIVERAGAVMQLAIGEAALQVRVGVPGIDPDRHFVVGDGAVGVAGNPVRLGPALERRSISRIERDRLTEIADGAIRCRATSR